MSSGLDILGAADALADQYVTLRIKNIDRDRLTYKLGGSTGTFAAAGLHFVDAGPKAALDIAVPIVRNKMRDYGIDAEITVSNVPPSKGGRALSEFWPGAFAGTVVGVSILGIWKLFSRLAGV